MTAAVLVSLTVVLLGTLDGLWRCRRRADGASRRRQVLR